MGDIITINGQEHVMVGAIRVTVKREDLRGASKSGTLLGVNGREVAVGSDDLTVNITGQTIPTISLAGATAKNITLVVDRDSNAVITAFPPATARQPRTITLSGEGGVNVVTGASGIRAVEGLRMAKLAPNTPSRQPLPIVVKGGVRIQPQLPAPVPTPVMYEIASDAVALGVTALYNEDNNTVTVSSNARLVKNDDGSITMEAISANGTATRQ